jgi:hypothetical protein
MRLSASVDRSVLVGALAVRVWDGLALRPCEASCRVTALLVDGDELIPVKRAVAHGSSLHGFLELRPGTYRLLVEPQTPQFLPTMRSLVVTALPAPPALPPAPIRVDAPLRPSAVYPRPSHWIALRGTVEWAPPRLPARWAVIRGTLALAAPPNTVQRTAWTRTDANGEFALFLRSAPPNSDGNVPALTATITIHSGPAPTAGLPAESRIDLGLDDGSDETTAPSLPLVRTLDPIPVHPDDELSANVDSYTTTPPGSSRLVANKVITLPRP